MTLFAGHGPQAIIDQKSRSAESLARTFAVCLRSVGHPKLPLKIDAMLVISPEHGRVLADDGWDRDRLETRLRELLTLDSDELVAGAGGIAEGVPEAFAGMQLPKFRDGGLLDLPRRRRGGAVLGDHRWLGERRRRFRPSHTGDAA